MLFRSSWEEYIHARLMCSDTAKPGRGFPTMHLSSGGEVMTGDDIGTKGLGYMAWGSGNRNPNVVSLLREASPYTASAHRFNTDLCAGRGPQAMYAYTQYVGGNLTQKRIPFKDAGVLIKGWIRDLKRELSKITQESGHNGDGSSVNAGLSQQEPSPETDALAADIREQIAALEQDYQRWKETNDELNGNAAEQKIGFLQRNNLHLSYLSLVEDMQEQNLCFPEILLQKRQLDANKKNMPTSMWAPKIVGLRYRSAHTCRLERRDINGRINYVYISNSWLTDAADKNRAEDQKIEGKDRCGTCLRRFS